MAPFQPDPVGGEKAGNTHTETMVVNTESPAKEAPGTKPSAAKNPLAGCQQCHVNVEAKYLKSAHFRKNIACTDCHGPSKGHLADENNEVKPDEVFARKDVDRLCEKCHPCSREASSGKASLPPGQRQVCTECHRAHDFKARAPAVPARR
jgi:hypothetical protein